VNYGSTQNIKIIYHFYEQQVEPDFKMNDQFVIENLQYVFGIDALETSRPINIEVNTPEEISSLFDAISYEKGT
jgi:aminopeptidase N